MPRMKRMGLLAASALSLFVTVGAAHSLHPAVVNSGCAADRLAPVVLAQPTVAYPTTIRHLAAESTLPTAGSGDPATTRVTPEK